MFQRMITLLVGRAVAVYHRVERRGPPLPAGPVLVVANHLNALIDPLVIFRTAGRPTRPLAKAPLFHHPLVGPVLVGLGGLPVFRPRDDPELVHRNASTFDAAIEALRAGEAVQIYPEGQSHSGASLTPLKTGAARIALEAEERAGWELGLRIVPVGLVYHRKHLFRGAAVAVYGEPLTVETWHDAWESDPRTAARDLTREIARRLAEVTLEAPSTRDRALVETAEALHARGRGEVRERERVPLGSRVDRLRTLARGIGRLQAEDPPRYMRLRARLERYRRLQRLLGSGDDTAVPGRYHPARIATYASRQSALLLLLGPVALVATVAWWVPYNLPRLVVRFARPALDAISTYKLAVAVLAFPATLAAWTAAAWSLGGLRWAAVVAVGLPLSGLGWIEWRARLRWVAEDLLVFLRAGPRRRLRTRLGALRAELANEVDHLVELGGGEVRPARGG